RPSVLSFDIETDERAERLLAIALYGCGVDEVYIVDSAGRKMPGRAVACANERAALEAFSARVRELDADVLTGWNVIDFDLPVLARIAARHRLPPALGRGPGRMNIRPARGYFGSGQATIPGRLVLDGVDLLRGAFVRMDEYSLDAVARNVLGEGKALTGDAHDRVGEILRNYAHDLEAFARYARTDARLALEIVERLDLVNLAVARSRLTGMTPDRVAASIASFDFLYLAELHKRRIVAPSVRSSDSRVHAAQAGGHVLEPVTGLHEGVWVFDFKSLYPSVIRTYNIDPLAYIDKQETAAPVTAVDDPIELAGGARFCRTPGILPGMLDELFPRREQAKRDGDRVASQAIKILMNSFYGVLGTPACRFYNPAIANAITGQGRRLLLWSKRWFEDKGFQVLYGDTDSLFVASGGAAEGAIEKGTLLAAALTADLADHIQRESRVESRLELELEKFYAKLFLPVTRAGTGGARKRYAGRILGKDDVEFTGMEVVRRDWTELAKQVQRELYGRLFRDEPIEDWLRDLVARLRAGSLDDWLVYRKGLRKRVEEYTAQTPPHVAAARKSKTAPGRVVTYLITLAGPEPLDNLTAEPDREHYVAKQVKPVAEPVLATLGLNFERVIGDDRQLGLF
ncbi:MAG: DNA polymerase II, partial [Gammaproteobacteria bacterium]|nr:DNA polymerase II [Gammaproteobacteria bacterium]